MLMMNFLVRNFFNINFEIILIKRIYLKIFKYKINLLMIIAFFISINLPHLLNLLNGCEIKPFYLLINLQDLHGFKNPSWLNIALQLMR